MTLTLNPASEESARAIPSFEWVCAATNKNPTGIKNAAIPKNCKNSAEREAPTLPQAFKTGSVDWVKNEESCEW